ncbi:hypothetical protein, partial [Klebsiella pneumoniae]|uniref:hypothetical protein n=1 Tax=Klebsiella pneumoniae TaxID=573 RepID=UPI003EDF68FE
KRLRIVPVGGASEVKKIFKHLEASYEEFKKDLKGKVFLLTDTGLRQSSISVAGDTGLEEMSTNFTESFTLTILLQTTCCIVG